MRVLRQGKVSANYALNQLQHELTDLKLLTVLHVTCELTVNV